MAKRLTKKEKEEIILLFTKGNSIEFLADKFECTKSTIVRNVKKNLGDLRYKELITNNKFLKKDSFCEEDVELNKNNLSNNLKETKLTNQKLKDEECFVEETFLEIAPLDYDMENSPRKELSSVPISKVDFPKIVYMIVDNKIELKIKILKDYPEWQFLPIHDLHRKTIEIYFDMNTAKRFCSKEQKVIKVPNTNVFKIVAPLLVSRGVSRIVSDDMLIAL